MTYASSYALGDLVAQAGSQVRGNCLVSLGTSTVSLPVVITHGSAPGPVLAITAGIHGGEYVPMVAVRQFVRDLDPALMRGTIVACLQSSPVAFQQRTAFVNPLDGQNLNRSFPGDPHGGPTARLAAWLWENLIARADYYVDCHCGDLPEALEPFAGVSPGPDGVLDERARAMADCFDVLFDGRDITALPAHKRVALGMARTFQITEIFPELCVFENVRVAAEAAAGYGHRVWISGSQKKDTRARAEHILGLVGLEEKARRLVGELAHGDQRAAEIAMALAVQPHLLLLDEPTAGMGDQETYAIAHLIRRLHRDHALTIVLIEHDMRVVFNLADRITVLDQGAVLAEGTPEEIAANSAVQAAYLGQAA